LLPRQRRAGQEPEVLPEARERGLLEAVQRGVGQQHLAHPGNHEPPFDLAAATKIVAECGKHLDAIDQLDNVNDL